MSESQWKSRQYSRMKWKEQGDGTGRMRYEKSHPWHFTGEGRDAAAKEAYATNYDLIDWSDTGDGGGNEQP